MKVESLSFKKNQSSYSLFRRNFALFRCHFRVAKKIIFFRKEKDFLEQVVDLLMERLEQIQDLKKLSESKLSKIKRTFF